MQWNRERERNDKAAGDRNRREVLEEAGVWEGLADEFNGLLVEQGRSFYQTKYINFRKAWTPLSAIYQLSIS